MEYFILILFIIAVGFYLLYRYKKRTPSALTKIALEEPHFKKDAKINALSSSELADFLMVYIEHQNWLVTEYRKIK